MPPGVDTQLHFVVVVVCGVGLLVWLVVVWRAGLFVASLLWLFVVGPIVVVVCGVGLVACLLVVAVLCCECLLSSVVSSASLLAVVGCTLRVVRTVCSSVSALGCLCHTDKHRQKATRKFVNVCLVVGWPHKTNNTSVSLLSVVRRPRLVVVRAPLVCCLSPPCVYIRIRTHHILYNIVLYTTNKILDTLIRCTPQY